MEWSKKYREHRKHYVSLLKLDECARFVYFVFLKIRLNHSQAILGYFCHRKRAKKRDNARETCKGFMVFAVVCAKFFLFLCNV